jgi:hypothetical protein
MHALPIPLAAVALLALVSASTLASADTPLQYTTQWTDPQGKPWPVAFNGTRAGSAVSGRLRVGDQQLRVDGIVAADGSVSGSVKLPNGHVATFAGRPEGAALRGTYTLGNLTADWSAPASMLGP